MISNLNFLTTRILAIFLLPLLLLSQRAPCEPPPFYVLGTLEHGIFADMAAVIGLLDHYETEKAAGRPIAGLEVNFADKGLYYEAGRGRNYWQYYMMPLVVGKRTGSKVIRTVKEEQCKFAAKALFHMPIKRANELIKKYIHFKPFIHEKVNNLVENNFKGNFVLGVHYRGTNKFLEAPLVTYEHMQQEVQKIIQDIKDVSVKIFVASDEQRFIDFMVEKFGDLIVKIEANRSTDGTPHYMEPKNQYNNGEEALIDCLLLSRCNFLLRTASNVSYFSILFNPKIPFKNISEHFYGQNQK